MTIAGVLQILCYLSIIAVVAKPIGIYLEKVAAGDPPVLGPIIRPVERLIYRICRINASEESDWKGYSRSLVAFSLLSMLAAYLIQRLQFWLPLNPETLSAPMPHSSFNTAAAFVTNTDWQSYGGETTMSYLTQMTVMTVQNFASAAVGIAVAIALIRGISRIETDRIGNFWADIVRITLYVLLPVALISAIFFVSQGVTQTFGAYLTTETLDGGRQTLAFGPVASQLSIKMFGTNGGGFFNANSAHPFENPTPLTNFAEMILILVIPAGLTYLLGRAVRSQGHGWAVFASMLILLVAGIFVSYRAESSGNPLVPAGVDQEIVGGNMEGKETRFGVSGSALFATVTTAASCGAVNSMHDSFTPVGGTVLLVNILLGEVVFGGVGAGLYGMLVFVILTVFIAGLMVGRTPEYLGKKIEKFEIQMATLYMLIFPITILFFASAAVLLPDWVLPSLGNDGPHGLSEILYAYASAVGNNGSAFAGLNANTIWFNTTLGIAMVIGRFVMIVPVLAIAGNLARKKRVPESLGTFPVSGIQFTLLLIAVILIVGALTFFPVLTLAGILEHFQMLGGQIN